MKTIILTAALLLATAFRAASQDFPEEGSRYAVVEFSTNFMREEPQYEAENGDQALMGTVVKIIDEKGYFAQ